MQIVNKNFSLNTRFFKIVDVTYEVIGTRKGIDNKVINAIDIIKNITSGKTKEMKRKELKEMLNKYKAVYIEKLH